MSIHAALTHVIQSWMTGKKKLFLSLAMLMLPGLASAQGTSTIPVELAGSPSGTLTYVATFGSSTVCGSPPSSAGQPNFVYWGTNTVQNFVYTDASGGRHVMSGGLTYRWLAGPGAGTPGAFVSGCPIPDGPDSLTSQTTALSTNDGSGYSISFTSQVYPFPGESGTAILQTLPFTLEPKFLVLAVTYAPPGAKSNVTYQNSTAQGTSTSLSNSFSNQNSVSVTLGISSGVKDIFSVGASGTESHSYTQEQDSSSSIALNTTTTYGRQIPGPASSTTGVDHQADVVWVWLNPIVNMTSNLNGTFNWTGYSFDPRDPVNEMDIVPLYVSWLENPQTIPADVAAVLARPWDTSGTGGLNATDYATILARDPLVNTTYNPNTDANHRFDLSGSSDITYEPPSSGEQPVVQTYSLVYQNTTQQGEGASDTYQTGTSIDVSASEGDLLVSVKEDLKTSNTLTWVNKWSSTFTNTAGQTASASITGPTTADNYTGPVRFQVWKDNVYGTFMFYPVP